MDIAAIITVSFIVGFGVGFVFARTARGRRRALTLRIFITTLAVIASIGAILGFIVLVSPTLALELLSKLPASIQNAIFWDIFMRGGTGFWSFLVVAGLLWWFRTMI